MDLKNGMYFLSRDELDDFFFFFFATDKLQFLSLGPVSFPFPLVFFLLLPSFLSFLKKRFKFVTFTLYQFYLLQGKPVLIKAIFHLCHKSY